MKEQRKEGDFYAARRMLVRGLMNADSLGIES